MAASEKDDFTAREYQTQLAEMAIEKNKIIFLPTGSGKTFISALVINHFLKQNDCASKKLKEGGKRAFFLVNTVALAHQQKAQLASKSPFIVKGYTGDMGVDNWDKSVWDKEFENQVLVMTSQIFLNLLLENMITLKEVAVLVFDECHHGVVDHPMRQIMQQFKNVPVKVQPRVLGLTATLLNKNVAVHKVDEEIKTLETTYLSQIATSDDENVVKMYSTNPKEFKVYYDANNIKQKEYVVRDRCFEEWLSYIQSIQIDDNLKADGSIRPHGAIQIEDRSKKTNKELKNVLGDIQVNMDDLGLYGGDVAVLARLIQMQRIMLTCQSPVSKTAFSVFNTDLVFLRKYFEIQMEKQNVQKKIKHYSADKLQKLFGILKKMKSDDTAIIFVKRRFTAKIMHKIVSEAAKEDPKLEHIRCDFVVGYNVTNPFKETRENLLQRNYNNRVLVKFNSGLLNVLFGSNVVEEGMDVSKCNMVIMFDAPLDFRSYTQSKGRARHADSSYIIMTSDPKYTEKYQKFKDVEDRLQALLCGGTYKHRLGPSKDEVDANLFANIPGLEPYQPRGNNGPSITALSAISLINRYFLSLHADKFTKVTPYWFMETKGLEVKCYLHLPMESKLRGRVEGLWQKSKENAKRSVALEACKKLHSHGELDDHNLLPVTKESRAVNGLTFLPHWDSDEKFEVGTKKIKRSWPKKWPESLTGCMPTAETQVYLHVLEIKVLYNPSTDNHRLKAFYQTLSEPVTYAIISSKPLPQLAPFPLYLSTGEIEVNVMKGKLHSFSEAELKKITIFHGVMFDKVVGVVKPFLIRDYSNDCNSYLIAPVIVGATTVEIDWLVITNANRPFPNSEVPSELERKSLVVSEENYLGMIVSPWYRTVPAQKYIVTKVCHDMNENTAFPSDNYKTYKEYFADKYKITPLLTNQPLLEARAISSRLNNLKPIGLTKALKRKNKDENEEFEVWLVPEFCNVYPVAGHYWLKAQLLPSVLHRVAQLCTAEEFRLRLVRDTCIGQAIFPPGHNLKKLEADASLAKHMPIEVTQLLTPLTIQMKNQSLVPKVASNIWDVSEEPLDIDRDMEVTLFDVKCYEEFASKPLLSNLQDESTHEPNTKVTTVESGVPVEVDPDSASSEVVTSSSFSTATAEAPPSAQVSGILAPNRKRKQSGDSSEQPARKKGNAFNENTKIEIPTFVTPPPLNMLQKNVQGLGPEQVQVLQAITAAGSKDLINCERLEMLGDSFLKFAISLALFENEDDLPEGILTLLKGQIVGNKNLYFCGKNKQLGNILEVRDFSPREEWIPPQFCVEHSIKGTIIMANLDPSCLYDIIIPEEEVLAGMISGATKAKFSGILMSAEDFKHAQTCTFTNQLALADKNISDAVEAVLGVYLENSGIFGALRVMNWFGVIDPALATESVLTEKMSTPVRGTRGLPIDHLMRPQVLEQVLHYKFKDQAYMLQALTHPTYHKNNITQSYQRLEFLGDAIIDFLITIHIYERCTELHPGDLTDLRSALVNNITLGCITVRHGLHRFLLHLSSSLSDMISRFSKHQEERQHQFDSDILFLCEEHDTNLADTVEVPKALGDVFEALIGAIYLDSGKNLEVTWEVIYNLMKDEIEIFHSDVPKNHVRMLYESKCDPSFRSAVLDDGVVMVDVEVMHEGEMIKSSGFGDNKHQAKRAAAKMALRQIRGSLVT